MAAVVLNHRTPRDTLAAVQSLLASDRPIDEVVVVDNDTDEGCRPALASVERHTTFISTGTNLGFSAGMNVGIRAALERGADAVLVVNSDVVVPPACVGRLEDALRTRADAGIAGPLVVRRSEPGRISSFGITYNPMTGRMRHRAVGVDVGTTRSNGIHLVDGVAGCLMLIKRGVFDAAGLFDERFFYSFEDLDLCLRARRAGFLTIAVGQATAFHEGGRTIGADSPRRLYFASRNHLLMAKKASGETSSVASACRTFTIVMLNVAHAVTAQGGSLTGRLEAVVSGARDYWNGRFGADS